jgi:hypothetical protein
MTDNELKIQQIRLEREINHQNIAFARKFKEWQIEIEQQETITKDKL